jgi:Flp pilus assembly protein TadD
VNGPYTQLFLTHIDAQGNDSPPMLLERFTSPDRAANIPEFVKLPGDAIADIREQFLDPYSFLRAGLANEHTGDHVGAERAYRRGLELDPEDAELRNALGWTLFQEGRSAEAVPEYRRALATNPRLAKAHNNLALALVELGQLEEAARHFTTSLEIDPKAEIYSDRGFTMAQLGRREQALADYQKALELDPSCASAHVNLAVASVQAGDLAEAEAHYRTALSAKPTAETHNGLGYVLAKQGRTDEAVAEFRSAIDANPKFTPGYDNIGDALAKQGKLEEAAATTADRSRRSRATACRTRSASFSAGSARGTRRTSSARRRRRNETAEAAAPDVDVAGEAGDRRAPPAACRPFGRGGPTYDPPRGRVEQGACRLPAHARLPGAGALRTLPFARRNSRNHA